MLKPTWTGSALARLGFVVSPDLLIYGLGGWTYVGFDTEGEGEVAHSGGAHGATAGVGAEVRLNPGWSFQAEYRFTYLPGFSVTTDTGSSSNGPTNFSSSNTSEQFSSSFSTTSRSGSSNSTLNRTRISGDLHNFRLGLVRYFD